MRGDDAFQNFPLEIITIPSTVISISVRAFWNCNDDSCLQLLLWLVILLMSTSNWLILAMIARKVLLAMAIRESGRQMAFNGQLLRFRDGKTNALIYPFIIHLSFICTIQVLLHRILFHRILFHRIQCHRYHQIPFLILCHNKKTFEGIFTQRRKYYFCHWHKNAPAYLMPSPIYV